MDSELQTPLPPPLAPDSRGRCRTQPESSGVSVLAGSGLISRTVRPRRLTVVLAAAPCSSEGGGQRFPARPAGPDAVEETEWRGQRPGARLHPPTWRRPAATDTATTPPPPRKSQCQGSAAAAAAPQVALYAPRLGKN